MPDYDTNPIATYVTDPANVIADAVFTPSQPSGSPQTTIRAELLRLDPTVKVPKDQPVDADIIALHDSVTSRAVRALSWGALKAALTAQLVSFFVPIGSVHMFASGVAPAGYLKCNGQTIGNGSSGATGRASADTLALFSFLWNGSNNTDLPIQAADGTTSTRGASASADFSANKRLPLPDLRGEHVRGWDDGRGVDAGRTVLSRQADMTRSHTHTGAANSGGDHTHTGSTNTTGDHNHAVNDPGHVHSLYGTTAGDGSSNVELGGSNNVNGGSTISARTGIYLSNGGAHSHSVTIASGGAHGHDLTINSSGGAETRGRNVALLFAIKL